MAQYPPSVWNQIVNSVFWLAAVIMLLVVYRKNKIKSYFSLLIATIFMVFNNIFMTLSYVYNDDLLLAFGSLSFLGAFIFESRFIDLVWHEKQSITRTSIVMFLSALNIYVVFQPDSIIKTIENGYELPRFTGIPNIIMLITLIIATIFACHWLYVSWKRSPPQLLKSLRLVLYAALIIGPLSIIIVIVTRSLIAFTIIGDAGLLIVGYIALKNPQILYLLPFSVDRVIIIDQESGLTIFHYEWGTIDDNSLLLGGLLKALQDLSFDTLAKGYIENIKFEKGVLIVYKGNKVLAGLITSKSSEYLLSSLKNFIIELEKISSSTKYDPNLVENFSFANELIEKYFGNIPKRT